MTDENEIKMDDLMKSNEWEPDKNDKNWKNEDTFRIMTSFNDNVIKYTIDRNFIERIEEYNELYQENGGHVRKSPPKNYGRIYKITNDDTGNVIVSYTTSHILYNIKLLVSTQLRKGGTTLKKLSDNIKNDTFSVEILEFVDSTNDDVLKKRRQFYHNEFMDEGVGVNPAKKKYTKAQLFALEILKYNKKTTATLKK